MSSIRVSIVCLSLLVGLSTNSSLLGAILLDHIDSIGDSDSFGYSTSISSDGTIIAIAGVNYDGSDDSTDNPTGHVRIYKYDSDTGEYGSMIGEILGTDVDGEFGSFISLSADGTRIAIGATLTDDPNSGAPINETGLLQVYEYDDLTESWTQMGSDIYGDLPDSQIGKGVSLSGDGTTVAVGSAQDDEGADRAGKVHVYTYDSTANAWVPKGSTFIGANANDRLGLAVALDYDGDVLAIGTPRLDLSTDPDADEGRVQIYEFVGSDWALGGEFLGTTANARLGVSIAMSDDGTIVAAGASDSGSGEAYTWQYDSGTGSWTQMGTALTGLNNNDAFGASIALSSDGLTMAVGADENGPGEVRVFTYDSAEDAWNQRGMAYTNADNGTDLGYSMDLSADAQFLIFGARSSGGGFARVLSLELTSHSEVLALISESEATGEDNVVSSPSDYELYTETEFNAERVAGQDDVVDDPASFNLYTETQIDEERVAGQQDVIDDPESFGIATGDDVAAARAAGQEDVTSNPGDYNLYTQTEIQEERTAGQVDVVSAPGDYYLHTVSELEEAVMDAISLVNISSRVAIDTGELAVTGFVVIGESKSLLVRAVGPKLADLGVASPLADPRLTIHRIIDGNAEEVSESDNWKEGLSDTDIAELNDAMESVGAFPLEPTTDFQGSTLPTDDTASAATIVMLDEGVYTITASSVDGEAGDVLLEVYVISE